MIARWITSSSGPVNLCGGMALGFPRRLGEPTLNWHRSQTDLTPYAIVVACFGRWYAAERVMKSQFVKDMYYATVGKATILSKWWHQTFKQNAYRGKFAQIGCGKEYIDGMVNVEANFQRKRDIWLDINNGLPFADNSIKGLYASHIMEHLTAAKNRAVYKDFMRVLEPGGKLRILVPDLEYAINAYVAKDRARFPDWPEAYQSFGGKFNNFTLVCNQHFVLFDFSLMNEFLAEAGFVDIERKGTAQSDYFTKEHMQFEHQTSWGPLLQADLSLIIEARKPAK